MKGIRNNLLNADASLSQKGKKPTASLAHVMQAYAAVNNQRLRMIPRMHDAHTRTYASVRLGNLLKKYWKRRYLANLGTGN